MKEPKITVILPTYNNEKTLKECLNGICNQNYKNYEIFVIDGGSDDKTVEISKKFKVKIIKNPHRNEERARVIGIKESTGEFLCFIDADNIIKDKDWLKKMIIPFEDKEIICSDTYYFTSRKEDNLITRYCSLIGGDDPLAIYLGIYDRYNYFKEDWTDLPYKKEKKNNYLKIKLDKKNIPAMGSNGFIFRKETLVKINYEPFIHTDIIYKLVNKGYFAKVNVGIIHLQGGVSNFIQKKIRRIKRRLSGEIKLENNYGVSNRKIIKMVWQIMLIFPVFIDSIKGFSKKQDSAWFFHPIATYSVFFVYLFYTLRNKLSW
jgi:glycosyltransferase involved in cell wall biosynthesis